MRQHRRQQTKHQGEHHDFGEKLSHGCDYRHAPPDCNSGHSPRKEGGWSWAWRHIQPETSQPRL
jgi:hypothetical protein